MYVMMGCLELRKDSTIIRVNEMSCVRLILYNNAHRGKAGHTINDALLLSSSKELVKKIPVIFNLYPLADELRIYEGDGSMQKFIRASYPL